MSKTNEFTRATLEVIDELRQLRERAAKADVPGFMEERLSLAQEATRVVQMTPEARKGYLEKAGMEHAMKVAAHLSRKGGR